MLEKTEVIELHEQKMEAPGCTDCIRRTTCPGFQMARVEQRLSGCRIQHPKPLQAGQHICQSGDNCDSIYIVRSGSFKSYYLDECGEIQVLGFHLPGEFFGVESLLEGKHSYFVQALGTASACRIPMDLFAFFATQTAGRPDTSLMTMVGQVLARDHKLIFMLSRMSAQRKFAYFLVDLIDRLRFFGAEQGEFTLSMSRADIANYLGLAIETVSRLFTQLQALGLLSVHRRHLKICDMSSLRVLANEQSTAQMLLDEAG